MVSNKGLNSKEALDESTATNSSVTLSGIRREKEAPDGLDIEYHSTDPENSDWLTTDYADLNGSTEILFFGLIRDIARSLYFGCFPAALYRFNTSPWSSKLAGLR